MNLSPSLYQKIAIPLDLRKSSDHIPAGQPVVRHHPGTLTPITQRDPRLGARTNDVHMRRGELLGLLWDNVDLERRTAFLPVTKNGESRGVPLSSRAVAVLRGLPAASNGRVFGELTPLALRLSFNRATRRAGITGLRLHDLRHEATSRFFEKGLNVMEVASVTGHKTLQMLKRYTHLSVTDLATRLG